MRRAPQRRIQFTFCVLRVRHREVNKIISVCLFGCRVAAAPYVPCFASESIQSAHPTNSTDARTQIFVCSIHIMGSALSVYSHLCCQTRSRVRRWRPYMRHIATKKETCPALTSASYAAFRRMTASTTVSTAGPSLRARPGRWPWSTWRTA